MLLQPKWEGQQMASLVDSQVASFAVLLFWPVNNGLSVLEVGLWIVQRERGGERR